jgi:hypothetical protein
MKLLQSGLRACQSIYRYSEQTTVSKYHTRHNELLFLASSSCYRVLRSLRCEERRLPKKKCIYLRKVTRNRVLINNPIVAHPSLKKIPALDEKQKLPVHQSKPLVPIWNQTNLVHILTAYFSENFYNIILPLSNGSLKYPLSFSAYFIQRLTFYHVRPTIVQQFKRIHRHAPL